MRGSLRSTLALAAMVALSACEQHQKSKAVPEASVPLTTPVAPTPPTPARAAAPDVAPAGDPPAPDTTRFEQFDRANLRKHLALLAFVKKTRAAWDKLGAEVSGKEGKLVAARVERLQKAQKAAIAAQARTLQPMNERSLVAGEHDTNLHFLADEYPTAIISAAAGDAEPLREVRAELERNEQKISAWLEKLRGPASPAASPSPSPSPSK